VTPASIALPMSLEYAAWMPDGGLAVLSDL
jgi:hypothetical protein